MEGFIIVCIAIMIVCGILKSIADQKLLEKNPQAWAAKKLVEEETKRRKRQSQAGIAMQVARMFFK